MRKIKQKIIHRKSGWEILPILTFLCCTCLLQLCIFLLLSFRFSSFVILFLPFFLSFFFPIDFAFPQTFFDTHPADFAFSSYFPCSFRTFHTLTLNKTRSLTLSLSISLLTRFDRTFDFGRRIRILPEQLPLSALTLSSWSLQSCRFSHCFGKSSSSTQPNPTCSG